jgi:hypothetical protein
MPVLGSSVELTASFVVGLVPTDPDAVALKILDPNGASTLDDWPTPADLIVHDGPGEFSYEFTPDVVGVWRWRWDGTGTAGAITEGTFEITSVFAPQTYASLDRAKALFETQPKAARLERLATALLTATNELTEENGGRDFFRHPSVGSEEFLLDDVDGRILHVHDGIVALDKLERRSGTTFTELVEGTDYILRGSSPLEMPSPGPGDPIAFHIALVNGSIWTRDGARLTGAIGWPAIPPALSEGCAARARQLTYGDATYEGAIASDDGYGRPVVSDRWPDVTYKFLQRERWRFYACLMPPDFVIA